MAVNTDLSLRRQVIYSVFVRGHTKEGTFRALEGDLDRLKVLGADILWLMPIHPIGEEGRKGTMGSPYAIRDYRAVNPDMGTVDDLCHLVDAIHDRGMKCIMTWCITTPRRTPCWRRRTRSSFCGTSREDPPARWPTGGILWIWITATATCGAIRSIR